MSDEKYEALIAMLEEIKQTMQNFICSHCRNSGKFLECNHCYACDNFEAKGAGDE